MAWSPNRAKAEADARQHFFATWSVQKKLLVSLIPSIALILVFTGYVTNLYSTRYLNQSLHRTAQTQNLAQAMDFEALLEFFRKGIVVVAESGQVGRDSLTAAYRQWSVYRPGIVAELAFVGLNEADTLLLVPVDGKLAEISQGQYQFIKNSPMVLAQKAHEIRPGCTQLSELTEVAYPPSAFPEAPRARSMDVYRMLTPVFDAQSKLRGHLIVSIDALALRNILSLYNSPKSPLFSFARSSENRFSFFFDAEGWMLFQSENHEDRGKELSVEIARLGMTGDYGMPEYHKAFRPSTRHESYWRMIVETQAGQQGLMEAEALPTAAGILSDQHFLVYAPVRFRAQPDKDAEIIGGLAYVDRSRLADAAEFRHMDVMAVITVVVVALIVLLVIFISRVITRPVLTLAAEISAIFEENSLRPVRLASYDRESMVLKDALNKMIKAIQDKQEQIRQRDEHIQMVSQRQKVSFDGELPASLGWQLVGEIPDLIGQSPLMNSLQSMIRKAAGSEADVLVVGETGTGKELTAEGIHKFSSRSTKPFISINCGGLDENLLLDALFGHVKGAFTEANADRKGAFLAANEGTLFLDEIGTASDKVQKALLRALSVRRIRPLGSDQEIDFNVRVVAATNVDLMELVQRGEFREDLYYRLKVITIQTPALRQRKEDIPLLANHFLKESALHSRRGEMGLSRGALEKLMAHDWPGNVRELKNCITRAMAFADGEVLYAEDLVFDDTMLSPQVHWDSAEARAFAPRPHELPPRGVAQDQPQSSPRPPQIAQSSGKSGNPRHDIAIGLAKAGGSFTRLDYQNALGADVSQRTAQYDLQTLVKGGVLRKTGKGPATQYSLGEV
ncbi:MAG: sigma-54 dependent transcriptional regulator [Humidesulfovibrio sp.]|uniref:sigma-54 dependent transcriptional regulator n=1 Tax=Humidesulfovibrio sp. TaxID=2910988 RepID=UPI0027E731AD|nr:sigma-54 dependent transcriptional regulator [Humidesulfovibrio sp.]MDQ7834680.1 sigma-54 dependent transcriptional regulator [Humidesulfovibrio sp.]